MPKKSQAKTPRIFVWDPVTETWDFAPAKHNVFTMVAQHSKTILGRPWTVYTHPDFPRLYFGRWMDDGPAVPPYR